MPKTQPETTETDVQKTSAKPSVVRDEIYLDDFLNAMEAKSKRELLAAFAYAKKKVNEFKKTLEEWKADLLQFENFIPK